MEAIDYKIAGENVLNIIAEYSKQINKLKWKHIHQEIKDINAMSSYWEPVLSTDHIHENYFYYQAYHTGRNIEIAYWYTKDNALMAHRYDLSEGSLMIRRTILTSDYKWSVQHMPDYSIINGVKVYNLMSHN